MDPTVMVLRVEDISGNIIGLITNYAGHPVGWGSHELGISRDYPGYALDVLEKVWGNDNKSVKKRTLILPAANPSEKFEHWSVRTFACSSIGPFKHCS